MTTSHSTVQPVGAVAARRPSGRAPIALRAAQLLLLVPLGALLVAASIYFTFVDPPRAVQAVDWLVAAWAVAIGAGNLYVGLRLAGGTPVLHRAALVLVVNHLLFGIVKVAGYGEQESLTFIVIDLLALALLLSPPVRRFFTRT